jgi:hypothetical protein
MAGKSIHLEKNSAPLEIHASQARCEEIAEFFISAFGPGLPPVLLSPQFLQWKFFEERPDWAGSRSYVAQQGDRIAAHACVWPTGFRTPSGNIGCSHLLDWAADPAVAGAGVTLYRHLMQLTDIVLAIGGSRQARRLLPKIGFRPYGTLEYYARVVRPFRQYRQRPRPSPLREIARLGRNTLWSLSPYGAMDPRWSATRREQAGDWLDQVVSRFASSTFCPGRRSAASVNYLLACPAAVNSLYSLACDGLERGYFVLNEVQGQTRVVDLFLNSEEPAEWEAACRVAFRTAASLATTCEVVAATSLPWLAGIFRGCGFRKSDDRPIMLCDPRQLLTGAPRLQIQMADSDAFYLYDPSFPFLT